MKDKIIELAEQAVTDAKGRGKILDYSENSIRLVEEMLDEAADFVEEMDEGIQLGIIQAYGSYILEVIRHQYGGTYYYYQQGKQPILVGGDGFTFEVITWDKVKGRLRDPADNIVFFYKGLVERIKNAKPGEKFFFV